MEGIDKTVTLEIIKKTGVANLINLIEKVNDVLKVYQQGIQSDLEHYAIETVKIKF